MPPSRSHHASSPAGCAPSLAGRRRGVWLAALVAVSIAGAVAWLGWHGGLWPEQHTAKVAAVSAAATPLRPSVRNPAAEHHALAAPAMASATVTDPLGSAPDLKHIFDEYVDSDAPDRRRIAARAFEACVPAFLPAAGQTPSPEPLIEALPPGSRTEREAAYRVLFARCHRFLADGRVALDGTRQALQRNPQAEALGLQAQNDLLAGNVDRVESLVAEAMTGIDPAAVESLTGLALRIAQSRRADGMDAATLQRARAVDAALPWVACDLGLDCSAQSLWALQLCAAEGLCEGDFQARSMARAPPGSVDPDAVQRERSRLLGLIRSGRALGTADLLP